MVDNVVITNKSIVTKAVEPFLVVISSLFFVLLTPWPLTFKSYIIMGLGCIIVPVNAFFASRNRVVGTISSRLDFADFCRWTINFTVDIAIVFLAEISAGSMTIIWLALCAGSMVDLYRPKFRVIIAIYSFLLYSLFILSHEVLTRQTAYYLIGHLLFQSFFFMISRSWHQILDDNFKIQANLKERIEAATVQLKDVYKQLMEKERLSVEKDKLATLGSMSAGISHEFNNSLNNLQQGVQAVLIYIDENDLPLAKELLQDMDKVIDLASDTIRSLKGLQKIEDQNKTIDLYTFITTICNLYKGLTFDHFKIENKIPPGIKIEVNELILYNSLANLIKNAIEASAESSKKTIVIESSRVDSNFIKIEISDFGCGITEPARSTIFDGISSKKDGLGFGLKHSKENLQKIQGDLELVHLNNPTTFRITLRA